MTPVEARGKLFCGFPRSGGRVLGVHGSGSFHRLVVIDLRLATRDVRADPLYTVRRHG